MEKKTPRPMTPFDELTTPYHLSLLKLFLPYLPPSNQQTLWILVKFMELEYTISIFKHPGQIQGCQSSKHFPDSPAELLDEITPYLPPELQPMTDAFHNIMNIMEMMQMFQESADFSNDSSDDSSSPFNGINPVEMAMGMMNPEQQEMFRMYQDMFAENDSTTYSKTGDDAYERMDEQPASKEHGSGENGTDSNGSFPDER